MLGIRIRNDEPKISCSNDCMNQYLIDANLPYRFRLWHNQNYFHVNDLDDEMPDSQIWEYAKEKNYVIVTKDADFSDRILLLSPPPRIVHIKLGNMKLNEFHFRMNSVWQQVEAFVVNYKLVRVFLDRIECIE